MFPSGDNAVASSLPNPVFIVSNIWPVTISHILIIPALSLVNQTFSVRRNVNGSQLLIVAAKSDKFLAGFGIDHFQAPVVVLTAAPKDMQAFLVSNLKTRGAFTDPTELTRKAVRR